ncbi:Ig-like domain-containing protein [Kineosporia babensis]|uniref:Ig-like domain-containing protein n=1 Tax=Kineosporia babensis TaxID=499548 RepID=A0A9X1NJM9_9ACTN|nr:Ig-like domain-containing protein [Kineosporia babensis]MCD5314794.1 Ig-like domain-containing protein [Kineosporia babensis]
MGRVSKWGAAWVAITVALVSLVLVAGPVEAAMNQPFGIRYQSSDTGDIMLRGNTLVACPDNTPACTAALDTSNNTATNNALNNDQYAMKYADVDTDNTTTASSSANVTLPTGATVKWAGLYWSGYTATWQAGQTAALGTTAKNRMKFRAPGDAGYSTVTASTQTEWVNNPTDGTAQGAPYVSFANVTAAVRNAGSGTYFGADVHAITGNGAYAAWSLVVVYRDPSQPQRNLVVFDGFGTVQNAAGDTSVEMDLTGLSAPASGTVNARLGAVVFEGDAGIVGDKFEFVRQDASVLTLSDAQNPANNFFNSTVTDGGTNVAGRNPSGQTFGFDADVLQSSLLLNPSDTTAKLRMTTGGERFFPAVATFVSNIYAPRLDVTRSAAVTDTVADGRNRPGDRITYSVDVVNNGDSDAANIVLSEQIPAGTTYVPNSLRIDGALVSDTADANAGEVSGTTVTARLGTGAGGSGGSGGTLAKNATARVTYTVEITSPYTAGGTVSGSSNVTYADTGVPPRTFSSPSNTTNTTIAVASTDLQVSLSANPTTVQRSGPLSVAWTATIRNNGPDAETKPVLVTTLPTGVTGITYPGAGATCTTSGVIVTCTLSSTLASNATANVVINGTLPANAADPSTASTKVSGDGTDPTPANNTATAAVGVNSPPTAVADSAPLVSPSTQIDIDVLGNDSDPNSGDELSLPNSPAGDWLVTPPAHGTATLVNGKVRYTLTDTNYSGTDTFTYKVCDNRGGCSTATSSVLVNDQRRSDLKVEHTASPKVIQQTATSREITWTAVVTNLGPQDEPDVKLTETLPAGVTAVTVNGATCTNVSSVYTCPLGAMASNATKTVTFKATLPANASDPSNASAVVSGTLPDPTPANNTGAAPVGINRPPLVGADSATLAADVLSTTVDVRANDSDPDSDPLTITQVSKPAHGTAEIVDGKVKYTLTDLSHVGPETISYTVCDGRGGCTDGTLTIDVKDHEAADLSVTQTVDPRIVQRGGTRIATWTVKVSNAGPDTAQKPVLTQTLPTGVTAIKTSLAACTINAAVVTCPMDNLASGASADVMFTATLPADAPDTVAANASVTSTSSDPTPANNKATGSVAMNAPPVADAETVPLPSTASKVTINVLGGDTDPDGDPLTLSTVTTPGHGTAKIVDGKVEYTLTDATFTGDDTFEYTVCDGRGGCSTALVTVQVADHSQPPVAKPDTVKVPTGGNVTIDVTGNDTDPNGAALTLTKITGQPAHGTAKIVDGKLVYTPKKGYVGTDTVRYQVCDTTGVCSEADVTVKVTSKAPVLKPDKATVRPGATTAIDVLANDTDPSGAKLGSLTIVKQPKTGIAYVGQDGKIHYRAPKNAAQGTEVTIGYRACNPSGACSDGTITMKVAGAPVSSDDGDGDGDGSGNGGGTGTSDGSGNGDGSGTGSGTDSGNGSDDGGSLAYTGVRYLGPVILAAFALMLYGLITRSRLNGPRSTRGRHKA